jgi:hypothetical protein
MSGAADEARTLFAGAGLGEPPIPRGFESQLRKIGKWHYATADASVISPYRFQDHEDAARWSAAPPSLVLAHAGHGANSYAIAYYLVLGNVRILLQLAWGGAYMDNDAAALRIRAVFEILEHRLPEIEHRARRAMRGELYHSDFYSDRSQPSPEELASDIEALLLSRSTVSP